MIISIEQILAEAKKLTEPDYIKQLRQTESRVWDSTEYTYKPNPMSKEENNYPLILAVLFLKPKYRSALSYELLLAFKHHLLKANCLLGLNKSNNTYLAFHQIEDYVNFKIITGITKKTTKKSLNLFNSRIIDKLFEVNGIVKNKRKKTKQDYIVEEFNDFTLTLFKNAYKPNSLFFTDMQRILRIDKIPTYKTMELSAEWSNAVLERLKPSMSGYRWLYNNTKYCDNAEIYDHIVVVGGKSFNTPVENYLRHAETERTVITINSDLSIINRYTLVKGAIQSKVGSPIYNHIVSNLQHSKESLIEYKNIIETIINDIPENIEE